MKFLESLHGRIIVAYLIFALASCALFGLIAAIAVEGIEVRLVDERLEEVGQWASARYAGKLPVEMPAGLHFHHGDDIPAALAGLAPGVHEVRADGTGLQVLAGRDATGNYVVVDSDSDYEAVELVVYSMVGAAALGFMIFSLFFGRYVARRIVLPITQLAGAVGSGEAELPLLANSDEMGVLARAFAARDAQARQFLSRERFFTGDVSHELRTPLTVITGAAELLVSQTASQPALQTLSKRVLRAADEAADWVSALLLLARSPQLVDAREIRMRDAVRTEVERYQFLVQDKPVQLLAPGEHDFPVLTHPELLSVAVGNLIRNACLYTQQGSVTVRLDGRTVMIEDTGSGVPQEVLDRLSDAADAPVASSAGSGLGLGLVMRLCDRLGATLRAAHRDGGGTLFSITFSDQLTKS